MDSIDKRHWYRSYSTHKTVQTKAGVIMAYSQLCKTRISMFAALSAFTGSVLATSALSAEIFVVMAGVFILACGAGALNQYQERDSDALMRRTAFRPVPIGAVESSHAVYIAFFLIVAGITIIALSGSWTISGLGMFALVWYNLIYTYLKQRTAFAAVPGAIVGAIPPAMGWVAGGGSLIDFALLPVCFFFFMWQIPHFWFLLCSHEEDYKKSDPPAFVKIFNRDQCGRIVVIWTAAAAVSLFLIPLFGIMLSDIEVCLLGIASVRLIWCGLHNMQKSNETGTYYTMFKAMNVYMLFVMAVINIGRSFNL
ncbi:MAG: protoheme IX farnesyltransferase [Nitrospiraceae bacterium]|nr:MAG: protoheme IX farnesyltransferase [Nitrospiraceae bacterium]